MIRDNQLIASTIGWSLQTIFKSENFSCSWWEGIIFSPPGKIIMFSPKVSDLWTENTFFLILFSRREWVGYPNQSIFPVPVVQLSPNFLHMVLNSLPRYHAKNFLIVSPFVYFLVHALIKIPSLAEIPSRTGRRELPIVSMHDSSHSLRAWSTVTYMVVLHWPWSAPWCPN